MRISDWSSHVCSSDLAPSEASGDFLLLPIQILGGEVFALDHGQRIVANRGFRALLQFSCMFLGGIMRHYNMRLHRLELGPQGSVAAISGDAHAVHASAGARRNETANRSEEHTSELQSLMRISYAVFCLKKKNTHITHDKSNQRQNT